MLFMSSGKMLSKKIIFLLIFSSSLYAKCYYVPCNAQVTQGKISTKENLNQSFNEVKKELDILKSKYKDLLEVSRKNNKELDIKLALLKEKTLSNSNILFLLKKSINLLSNQNNIEGLNK
ncbi:hypothetical protein EJP16_08280 [Campylobacter coli]|nr:hypothetical protein [Campylobacter coli]EAH7486149.1 hypothetical protein [Campylobacter jejuni]EAH6988324.1 hypothetical protein [Campylobacter coli]EAH7349764.1 hypothetical protein [Campylobacter coli]EAH7403474.1 hypothetical protein [Campylobacter coli]